MSWLGSSCWRQYTPSARRRNRRLSSLSEPPPRKQLFAFQRDRVHVAAIVRLFPVHRAAIAEAALVGIGVDAEIVDDKHAGIFQPQADQAGEIEHRVAVAL